MQGALTRKKSHGMAPLWALLGPYRGPIDPRMQALLEATTRIAPVFERPGAAAAAALARPGGTQLGPP